MDQKVRILHLWNDEKEAERFVRTLADTDLEFEAKLVKSESEYISSLLGGGFHIIIIDSRADFHRPGTDELSAREIALEVAPDVPFLAIGHRRPDEDPRPSENEIPLVRVPRRELHRLGALIRTACNLPPLVQGE
ncbi:MAG: hypothetical protein ABFD97_18580 [Syntrophobacter sp.]